MKPGSKLLSKILMEGAKRAKKVVAVDQPQVHKKLEAVQKTQSPYFSPKKTRNYLKTVADQEKDAKPDLKKLQNAVSSSKPKRLVKIDPIKEEKPKIAGTKDLKELQKAASASNPKQVEKTATLLKDTKPEIADIEESSGFLPPNFYVMLDNIRQMRKTNLAPVDTMGCDNCSDDTYDEKTQRYHSLVSLMLSSQTKDQINFAAMQKLRDHGLTPENIVKTDSNTLEQLIYPVSFYRQKAKNLQKAAQILIDQYGSDIPNTVESLMKLPGVGPKMAHICMQCAWHEVSGIGVDTHVHRIANWLQWVPKATKTPEETRVELEKWLPRELWGEINHLLVGFGQTVCNPVKPKCNECSNASICPAAFKLGSVMTRKRNK